MLSFDTAASMRKAMIASTRQGTDGTRNHNDHRQERDCAFDQHQRLSTTRDRQGIRGTERRGRVVGEKEVVEELRLPIRRTVLGCRRLRKDPIMPPAKTARSTIWAAAVDLPEQQGEPEYIGHPNRNR